MIGGILLTVGSAADQVRVSETEYSLFSRGPKNQRRPENGAFARAPRERFLIVNVPQTHNNPPYYQFDDGLSNDTIFGGRDWR